MIGYEKFRPEPIGPESVVELERLEHDVRDDGLPDLEADGYSWDPGDER